MLQTNLQADSAEQMWSMYMQLTEAETYASHCTSFARVSIKARDRLVFFPTTQPRSFDRRRADRDARLRVAFVSVIIFSTNRPCFHHLCTVCSVIARSCAISFLVEHAAGAESIVTTLQPMVFLNAVDYVTVKTIGFAWPEAAVI